jgi:hypothetical protein
MDYSSILQGNQALLLGAFIWSIFWKALALWRAARYSQKNWFIAIVILNTLGIVELFYLFYFAKKRMTLKDFTNRNFLPE